MLYSNIISQQSSDHLQLEWAGQPFLTTHRKNTYSTGQNPHFGGLL